MLDKSPSIRLELDIPAKRLISQYVTQNKQIEEQVKKVSLWR